ncbi:hypothetical protein JCM10207_008642 [Rhodosporidiobolus poonsookiae]
MRSTLRIPSLRPRQALWWDVLFISTVTSGQLNSQGIIGSVMVPTESIAQGMLHAGTDQYAWMNASYALTAGLFVILGGRLGDKYAAKNLFLLGYLLLAVFNLITGFLSSAVPFHVLRALTGIGAAFVVPNAVALLARQYPPGMRRTVAFAVLGALAPIGFQIHAAFASLVLERIGPRWIFWLEAIASVVFLLLGTMIIPPDEGDPSIPVDWVGAALGLSGMTLFNFAWNQAPLPGWEDPYVPTLLAVGLLLVVLFFLWERRQGERALLPTVIFTKDVVGVCLALWWGWMSFGIFLYYTIGMIRDIRGFHQPLVICAQLVTLAPFGALAALCVVWLNSHVKGHFTLAAAMACFCVGNLIMGLTPRDQSFWAMIFPAEVVVVFGPDLSFASGALIIANSVPSSMAGIGGGLITLMSIGLGIAGTIEMQTNSDGGDILRGYHAAFWFAAATMSRRVSTVELTGYQETSVRTANSGWGTLRRLTCGSGGMGLTQCLFNDGEPLAELLRLLLDELEFLVLFGQRLSTGFALARKRIAESVQLCRACRFGGLLVPLRRFRGRSLFGSALSYSDWAPSNLGQQCLPQCRVFCENDGAGDMARS